MAIGKSKYDLERAFIVKDVHERVTCFGTKKFFIDIIFSFTFSLEFMLLFCLYKIGKLDEANDEDDITDATMVSISLLKGGSGGGAGGG